MVTFHFPNNLKALRGTISLQALRGVSKLGIGRLKELETAGVSSRLSRASLEGIAKKLGYPLEQVFPTEAQEPLPEIPFVQELIEQQTKPQPRPQTYLQRRVRLLEPHLVDGVWEVHLDVFVANRALLQDLISAAEAKDGWRSESRQVIKVDSGRKWRALFFCFQEGAAAEEFYAHYSGLLYTPDPPPPIMEVVHRGDAREIASENPFDPSPLGEAIEDATPVEGDELVLRARLSPKLMGYYKGLCEHYGPGVAKAIIARGLSAMAAEFDL